MKKHLALAAMLALAISATAKAEDAPPPSPEAVAAARAAAEAIIASSGMGDVFENVTETDQPKLRHRASGMTCTARDKPALKLTIYNGPPRGDDVSCGADIDEFGLSETLYAARRSKALSATEAVQGSVASMNQLFADLEPYRGEYASYPGKHDFPDPVTARFEGRLDGERVFTRVSAIVVGDWVIRQRVTAPLKDATLADIMSEVSFQLMLEDLAKASP